MIDVTIGVVDVMIDMIDVVIDIILGLPPPPAFR